MNPHPSSYIREELHARGWTYETLAKEAGVDIHAAYRLAYCCFPMTEEHAEALAGAFGTSAAVWMGLWDEYEEGKG